MDNAKGQLIIDQTRRAEDAEAALAEMNKRLDDLEFDKDELGREVEHWKSEAYAFKDTAQALTKSNVDAEAVLVEMTALAVARLDLIKGLEESDKTLRKDLEIAVADVVELREALETLP
jgi:antitoxin component HigA of HigAB toxin-antitoxin module